MSAFKITCLSSSSTANSYAVELAEGQKIAIECGIHPEKFLKEVGIPDSYWVSHKHMDHARYEGLYSRICGVVKFKNEFSLEHGTIKSPCDNRGFYIDEGTERLLFATDFYDFEKVNGSKAAHGIAMVECSHDFPLYDKLKKSEDSLDRMKALQWENHACEIQTVKLLQHFFTPNFDGEIILLHRSANAYKTMGYSEIYVRNKFPLASVKWAQNLK